MTIVLRFLKNCLKKTTTYFLNVLEACKKINEKTAFVVYYGYSGLSTFEKTLGIFNFLTLPWKFRRKQRFTTRILTKLCYTLWKFQAQKPRPMGIPIQIIHAATHIVLFLTGSNKYFKRM